MSVSVDGAAVWCCYTLSPVNDISSYSPAPSCGILHVSRTVLVEGDRDWDAKRGRTCFLRSKWSYVQRYYPATLALFCAVHQCLLVACVGSSQLYSAPLPPLLQLHKCLFSSSSSPSSSFQNRAHWHSFITVRRDQQCCYAAAKLSYKNTHTVLDTTCTLHHTSTMPKR